MRLQALGDPRLMAQLRQVRSIAPASKKHSMLTTQANPEFASAIQAGGSRFKEIIRRQESTMRAAAEEKERQIEVTRPSRRGADHLVAQRGPVRYRG